MRINLKLTPNSADEALNAINEYRTKLVDSINALGTELADTGVVLMRTTIMNYEAFESGELLSSVIGYFDPTTGKGYVGTSSGHAAFVEFGTGVVGANPGGIDSNGIPYTTKPYSTIEPKPSGWNYDVNNHGEAGWTYQGGRWTRGQPPRPFVYETWLTLSEIMRERMMEIRDGRY